MKLAVASNDIMKIAVDSGISRKVLKYLEVQLWIT